MRYVAMAGLGLLAMTMAGGIQPAKAEGISGAPIVLAQAETKKPEAKKPEAKKTETKKTETIKQKVKRVWRNMTGYKFAVACPALIPLNHSTCTETGKNRADARAKCQSANAFCSVNDVR